MAIRIIVKNPDPVLRKVALPVNKVTSNIQKLLTDMAETMYEADGIGLAAPQVGISKRVIVVDVRDEEHGLIEMINPEIIEQKGEQIGPEGCLSIPGINGDVKRYMKVKVKGLDRHGNELIVEADELLARAFQHEIDHLNGVLFIDKAQSIYEIQPEIEEPLAVKREPDIKLKK